MSLVSYEYSDSEENDEPERNEATNETETEKNNDLEELPSEIKLFSSLPVPRAEVVCVTEENDEFLIKKSVGDIRRVKKKPVKIIVPNLADYDSDEDTEPPKKLIKTVVPKSTGLFAMLPPPKAKIESQMTRLTKLVPTKIQKNKLKLNVIKKAPTEDKDDSDDEKIGDNYLTSVFTETKMCNTQPLNIADINVDSARAVRDCSSKDNKYFSSLLAQQAETDSASKFKESEKEETEKEFEEKEMMTQLVGKSKKKRKNDKITFIDIKQTDSRDWMVKSLTEEKPPVVNKEDEPSMQSRRKHQITYLAYQAKMNEQELKNQWAMNRMTRKQTQAKYGF